jgi:serpin B
MQTEGHQAVELDYRGGGLSMLVLLPVKEDGLRDLEEALSARMLRHCEARMIRHEVKLFLPRFRMTWGTAEIGDPLRALGMRLAFTRQADFSGINGYEPPHEESLFINAVFHKAFVDVNEEGTEAAASSAVMVVPTMSAVPSKPPPVPVFRADHPFLFAIRDQRSDAILFLGRVAEPTQES